MNRHSNPKVVARKSSSLHSSGSQRIHKKSLAMKEIYAMQKYPGPLFRRLPFARIVKYEIEEIQQRSRTVAEHIDYRIQFDALDALQQAAEAFLVDLFAMCQLTAEHSKRVTIMDRDLLLVLRIRKLFGLQ
ncbi:Histone_H3 [Hexamita inflata]|uniref:Histone H3 n=1 Tax=Hexamita inflata TaxID=28002 RepID=A0AA86N7B0_9EUKA|nr:Histone H3 [Hexamita inflata]CAI9915524.1 Histone H3 [Hexamita inflata]